VLDGLQASCLAEVLAMDLHKIFQIKIKQEKKPFKVLLKSTKSRPKNFTEFQE
jgi:hypothetical protein